ncbi:MAG: holo-ACP synthase [Syntrophorhabdales bacterium]|jgi:holo-[acyl-carrier protein] synthase
MIGVDIVEVARIERAREVYGERFLRKVFTAGEIAHALARRRWAESLAGRFAAKEAFMKAWGSRLSFSGIEVVSGRRGRPFILFQGKVYEEVSISHERKFAVSVVRIGRKRRP